MERKSFLAIDTCLNGPQPSRVILRANTSGEIYILWGIRLDTVAFGLVLEYLHYYAAYPFFWSKEAGFDHALYHRVEQAAGYLELFDLRDWIRNQKYLSAITTITEETIEEIHPGQAVKSIEHAGDT